MSFRSPPCALQPVNRFFHSCTECSLYPGRGSTVFFPPSTFTVWEKVPVVASNPLMARVQAVIQIPHGWCCAWVCKTLVVCWVTNRAENQVFPVTVSSQWSDPKVESQIFYGFLKNTSLKKKKLFSICASFVARDYSQHSFSTLVATTLYHSCSLEWTCKSIIKDTQIWGILNCIWAQAHEMNLSCYGLKSLIVTFPGCQTHTFGETLGFQLWFVLKVLKAVRLKYFVFFVSEWVNAFHSLFIHIVEWHYGNVSSSFHMLSFWPVDPSALHVQNPVKLPDNSSITLSINQSDLT